MVNKYVAESSDQRRLCVLSVARGNHPLGEVSDLNINSVGSSQVPARSLQTCQLLQPLGQVAAVADSFHGVDPSAEVALSGFEISTFLQQDRQFTLYFRETSSVIASFSDALCLDQTLKSRLAVVSFDCKP